MRKMFVVFLLVLAMFFGTILPSIAREKKEIVIGMTLCLTGKYAVDVGPFDRMVKRERNYRVSPEVFTIASFASIAQCKC